MISKKTKALVAGALAATMTLTSVISSFASAAGQGSLYKYGGKPGERSKAEKFGDDTYAKRFLSLYDDVITNGAENGYLSKTNKGKAADSFGVPYHAIETLIIEAPDYGHVTTSEAMSYIVWVAAMRDKIGKDGVDGATATKDLTKAWSTLEAMVPGFGPNGMQKGIWSQTKLSAQYAPERQDPKEYPVTQDASNTGENPLYTSLKSAYGSDAGQYLMHWLADVDDWYGFGGSAVGAKGPFTFINTFQRGEEESCWETVPHPSIEEKKYGNATQGVKGVFATGEVAAQWSYTNAPDAEDRGLQAVYAANKWGVGDATVTGLAGKMGDQLRNDMFDKYYKEIGCQLVSKDSSGGSGVKGQHFLRAWYSAWGGAIDGTWAWQIGASHMHQFYQNPLAAYALLYDSGMKAGMKSAGAVADYEKSFERQMEMYLWLQSPQGPIAGGCTNSWNGRYEKYPSGTPTFYDMAYVAHPVYVDPGSNNWIGNQLWSVQRLAELYYYVKTDGDMYKKPIGGMTLEAALDKILSKWLDWFLSEVELNDDGSYAIPASVSWSGAPDTWNGAPSANSGLKATAVAWGSGDLGCVANLANAVMYYAKAKGVTSAQALAVTNHQGSGDAAARGLYMAKELLDRMWKNCRDNVGLSQPDINPSLVRFFDQEVHIPATYSGTMPDGSKIQAPATFLSLREQYKNDEDYARLKADYDNVDASLGEKTSGGDYGRDTTRETQFTYHRFWHACDLLMGYGGMYLLYPDMPVGGSTKVTTTEATTEKTTSGSLKAKLWGDANDNGEVTIDDVVAVRLYCLKPSVYPLNEQGYANALVVTGQATVQGNCAVTIQDFVVEKIKSLPIAG